MLGLYINTRNDLFLDDINSVEKSHEILKEINKNGYLTIQNQTTKELKKFLTNENVLIRLYDFTNFLKEYNNCLVDQVKFNGNFEIDNVLLKEKVELFNLDKFFLISQGKVFEMDNSSNKRRFIKV